MYLSSIQEIAKTRFAKDTIWLIAAQAVLMASGLGINLIIGSGNGAESLGIFNQSLALYSILSTLFAFGLNNQITKEISDGSKSKNQQQNMLLTSLILTGAISGSLSFLVISASLITPQVFSSPELAGVVYIPMFALPFFNLNKNIGAYYTGLRNQKRFAMQRIVRWVVMIGWVCCCQIQNAPIHFFLWCFPVSEGLVFLMNAIELLPLLRIKPDFSSTRENMKFGLKSYVAEIISVLNASLDVILIGYFLTNAETGIYSFIVYFAKTLYIFPGIMMQNFSPIVSKTWATGKLDELKSRMHSIRRMNRIVVSLQLIALLIVYPIVTLFIKQEFNSTFSLFLISVVGAYIFSLISWSGSMLIMTNKLNENIARTLLIILLSATCTLGLTNIFGLTGSCIAYCVNGIIAFFATRQFIHSSLKLSVT
jgi:O-antigen/teichoic acid export membrane protein